MTINILSLSVVFPAYNEQDNIFESIGRAEHVLSKLNLDYEIIVVNDGSSDSTRDIVEDFCRRNERLHIINHEINLGYGAAVCSGITYSSKEYVFLLILICSLISMK